MSFEADYDTINRAVHFLERWEQDPYRWNVDRVQHLISPIKKILLLVKRRMELGATVDDRYPEELLIAQRVIELAEEIIREPKS